MERALRHKYPVGTTVYFTASNISRPAARGTYEVIRQLPTEGDDCQYRIKSATEAFERVAKEVSSSFPEKAWLRHDLSDLGYDRAFDKFRPRGRKASPRIIFYAA